MIAEATTINATWKLESATAHLDIQDQNANKVIYCLLYHHNFIPGIDCLLNFLNFQCAILENTEPTVKKLASVLEVPFVTQPQEAVLVEKDGWVPHVIKVSWVL